VRDEFFEEQVVFRRLRDKGERVEQQAKVDDSSSFLYDLVIIVAGFAGVVILLRLLVEALAA
jgi:uncharacterized membrane protein